LLPGVAAVRAEAAMEEEKLKLGTLKASRA
jgi:hypothetical protein